MGSIQHFMNWCNIIWRLWLYFFMNFFTVHIQLSFPWEALVLNATFEWHFSIMKWYNVFFQIIKSSESCTIYIYIYNIYMASFLHELIQCDISTWNLQENVFHICCIWKASFFHELMLCVCSSLLVQKSLCHKIYISIWSLLYGLIQYGHPKGTLM